MISSQFLHVFSLLFVCFYIIQRIHFIDNFILGNLYQYLVVTSWIWLPEFGPLLNMNAKLEKVMLNFFYVIHQEVQKKFTLFLP